MAPRDLPFDPAASVDSLGELDETGTFAAMFDGSVRHIDGNIDPQVLAHLALYRDEYEAEHPDEALDWASAHGSGTRRRGTAGTGFRGAAAR
jgi:hypothetical protein